MNVQQLREAYKDKDFIPYVEFLRTDEWKQKREEVLKRDGYKCTNCGHRETIEHYDSKAKQTIHYWFDDDGSRRSLLPQNERLYYFFKDKVEAVKAQNLFIKLAQLCGAKLIIKK